MVRRKRGVGEKGGGGWRDGRVGELRGGEGGEM